MRLEMHEYHDLCEDYAGYCTACGEIGRDSSTEPDAEGYECWECGEAAVMGIEQAMMLGYLHIEPSKTAGGEA